MIKYVIPSALIGEYLTKIDVGKTNVSKVKRKINFTFQFKIGHSNCHNFHHVRKNPLILKEAIKSNI
jgi:hypothetical protein